MILLPRGTGGPGPSRRHVLVAGALAVAATPLAACSPAPPPPPPPPDPLEALTARAHADAALAGAAVAAHASLGQSVGVAATTRGEHAAALDRELGRAHPGHPSAANTPPGAKASTTASAVPSVPPAPEAALTSVVEALAAAEKEAADAMLALPRYQAGLVGSIAASCACLREVLT